MWITFMNFLNNDEDTYNFGPNHLHSASDQVFCIPTFFAFTVLLDKYQDLKMYLTIWNVKAVFPCIFTIIYDCQPLHGIF